MKIMGIDSSGMVASVAVADEENLIAEFTVNNKKTHSQTLLLMIDEVIKMSGIPLPEIDAFAIASGPGSFTGLRIGSSTVKGLGMVLEKPVIEVPTLEGLAFRLSGCTDFVCPMMDARRSQVYSGLYDVSAVQGQSAIASIISQRAVPVSEMLQMLNEIGRTVVFLGDGVPVYREKIDGELSVPHRFAPVHLAKQSAAAVAVLGGWYAAQGKFTTAEGHRPEYLRQSQAERERAERIAHAEKQKKT